MVIESETLSLLANCAVLGVMLLGAILIALLFLGLIASYYFKRQTVELMRLAEAQEKKFLTLLKEKREARAKETLVPDADAWASQLAGVPGLKLRRADTDLRAAEWITPDGRRVVLAPLSAGELRRAGGGPGRGRLANYGADPWLKFKAHSVQHSLLTDDYFDLEVEQAGAKLGLDWSNCARLWTHAQEA